MTSNPKEFNALLAAVKAIATKVAGPEAADVDARARFPDATVQALRDGGLLSAAVPAELGGAGLSLLELAQLCATLGQACGSSAMVLAMHYIQVGCMARHGMSSEFFRGYLQALVREQYLLASMTSENGTFGETRTSICAVERSNGRFTLAKDATTGSYCAQADAILVTARRAPDAVGSDQVLVLVRKGDYTLNQTTSWDTLGMRGTCSPGFKLDAAAPEEQIVPGSFADSSAQSMVPYSHILWSSLWWGIAADAVTRAGECVRASARKNPGTVPPTALRLAEVTTQLQALRNSWQQLAGDFDDVNARPDGMQQLLSMSWALKLNNLKISASEAAPQIVHRALQIAGIVAYKNDTKFSLGRHYRDVLSASLMISNERIAAKNAAMLLVLKET
jgi:acyl-CoA dehydrogenase